jgi:hypothetical protein
VKTVAYPKLIQYHQIRNKMKNYSAFEKSLNAFDSPLYLFEDWFESYREKSNQSIIRSYFFWDSSKEESFNIHDLFFLCDTNIYMIQPFDVIDLEKMNPIKLKEENKCHSEDIITVQFQDYDSDKALFSYSFQRGLYLKSNLVELLKINQKYFYSRFIKISFSYSVSNQGVLFFKHLIERLSLMNKEDFNQFEKFVQNLFFQSISINDFRLPTDYEQENDFLMRSLDTLTSKQYINKYKEEVFLLGEYFSKRNLEIFFIINKDFGKGHRIEISNYTVLSHYMKSLLSKLFWKSK